MEGLGAMRTLPLDCERDSFYEFGAKKYERVVDFYQGRDFAHISFFKERFASQFDPERQRGCFLHQFVIAATFAVF